MGFSPTILYCTSLFIVELLPHAQGSSSHPGPPTVGNTSGVGGGGERPFPPNSGLTFSTWVQITRCVPDSSQTVGLLTLSQTFLTHDKQVGIKFLY